MFNQFQKRGYNRSLIKQQIDKAIGEITTLERKKENTSTTIPSSIKFNRALAKIKEVVIKHWHFLLINPNLA